MSYEIEEVVPTSCATCLSSRILFLFNPQNSSLSMNRLFLLFIALIFAGHASLFSQSPYQFDWKKESVISGIGLSTWGSSYLFANNIQSFSPEQVYNLDRARVNSFDRVATFNQSYEADKTSDYLALSSKLLPVLFLAGDRTRENFHEIAFLYAETYLVANGLTTMTKSAVGRPRPFVYNESFDVNDKLGRGARYSFFSGHTSKTAALSFFSAKVYADFHPESEWRPFVWAAAATLPAVTGYLRVKSGKHYPSDVMVGYAVGALTGILVPHLHKRNKKAKNKNLRLSMGAGVANMQLVF